MNACWKQRPLLQNIDEYRAAEIESEITPATVNPGRP